MSVDDVAEAARLINELTRLELLNHRIETNTDVRIAYDQGGNQGIFLDLIGDLRDGAMLKAIKAAFTREVERRRQLIVSEFEKLGVEV